MNKFNLDTAVSKLTPEQKDKPIFIVIDGPFMDSPLYFYEKSEYYEAKYKKIRETIKSRGDGQPTKSEIELAVKRFNEKYKKTKFNMVYTVHYGNWVVEGLEITKKTLVDKDAVQMIVDMRFKS